MDKANLDKLRSVASPEQQAKINLFMEIKKAIHGKQSQ